jgi:hypothetical protein
LQCPRCNTVNSPESHFCRMCGLPFAQQGGASLSPSIHQLPLASSPAEWPRQAGGQSVLFALRVGRPARWQFWVGVALLAMVFVCCPCSVGVLIFGSDAVADPAGFVSSILGLGGCLFVGALVLGIILVVVGRPRRMQ